jgi:hypothetical protein
MHSPARVPLIRVWVLALIVFLVTAWISRLLAHGASPMSSYWIGLVGLLAIGAALVTSWRGLAAPGFHAPGTRRALRTLIVIGGLLWAAAMVFPFL